MTHWSKLSRNDLLQTYKSGNINSTVLLMLWPQSPLCHLHHCCDYSSPYHHDVYHAGGDILEGMPPGQVKTARNMLQELRVNIVTNAMVSLRHTAHQY